MARPWYWRGVDARVRRRGAAGRARRYMARRVGAERAGAGLLPQVEFSSGRPARVSVRLRPTKGPPNAARGIDRLLATWKLNGFPDIKRFVKVTRPTVRFLSPGKVLK